MNFNPDNTQGLLSLIEALKNGLDPSTGMQLYGQIQSDQATAIANRQQRMQEYNSLLSGAAASGMPYEGALAQAQAMPGPMPPYAQQALTQLYPGGYAQGQAPAPPTNANGQVMDFPAGSRPTETGMTPPTPQGMQYPVEQVGPQMTSPAMDPNVALQQQYQAMQMEQMMQPPAPTAGQIEDANFAQMVTGIQTLFDKGKSPDEIRALIMQDPTYSGLFVSKYRELLFQFPQFTGIGG